MEDEELKALRAKRLAELQQQQIAPGPQNNQGGQEDQKAKEEEFRNHVLSQVLSQEARSRLSTISIAKPEKGRMVENMIINMARTGQLRSKLQEQDFIGLLEHVSEKTNKKTTVKFDRRRAGLDSDDDL